MDAKELIRAMIICDSGQCFGSNHGDCPYYLQKFDGYCKEKMHRDICMKLEELVDKPPLLREHVIRLKEIEDGVRV